MLVHKIFHEIALRNFRQKIAVQIFACVSVVYEGANQEGSRAESAVAFCEVNFAKTPTLSLAVALLYMHQNNTRKSFGMGYEPFCS